MIMMPRQTHIRWTRAVLAAGVTEWHFFQTGKIVKIHLRISVSVIVRQFPSLECIIWIDGVQILPGETFAVFTSVCFDSYSRKFFLVQVIHFGYRKYIFQVYIKDFEGWKPHGRDVSMPHHPELQTGLSVSLFYIRRAMVEITAPQGNV